MTLAVSQTFQYYYIENVAMATIMIYYDRAYRAFSNGASHNSSQTEAEMERFKSFTFDYGCDLVIHQ